MSFVVASLGADRLSRFGLGFGLGFLSLEITFCVAARLCRPSIHSSIHPVIQPASYSSSQPFIQSASCLIKWKASPAQLCRNCLGAAAGSGLGVRCRRDLQLRFLPGQAYLSFVSMLLGRWGSGLVCLGTRNRLERAPALGAANDFGLVLWSGSLGFCAVCFWARFFLVCCRSSASLAISAGPRAILASSPGSKPRLQAQASHAQLSNCAIADRPIRTASGLRFRRFSCFLFRRLAASCLAAAGAGCRAVSAALANDWRPAAQPP